eukprot:1193755-Prorocentrum_minimum.AAC.1
MTGFLPTQISTGYIFEPLHHKFINQPEWADVQPHLEETSPSHDDDVIDWERSRYTANGRKGILRFYRAPDANSTPNKNNGMGSLGRKIWTAEGMPKSMPVRTRFAANRG